MADSAPRSIRLRRGRLKVFFGAAPGVGKTYAMLEEGRARAAEGADVVVGYAEPHRRPETEALLLGMELLPPLIPGNAMASADGAERAAELDLDAALRRRPTLLLVDELAHANPPGFRHQKRWQDVNELLDAGIDVYTTLNVQDLESVNDVVERITGVKVRETLPDWVLERTDELELVDTSPDELLERLAEGKLYPTRRVGRTVLHGAAAGPADGAARGLRRLFDKGNLIALREMALRRTADRVGEQMQDFRRDHAVRQTWAAGERILVCVGPSPLSASLIRSARRLAAGLKVPWIAAYVETPAAVALSAADRDRVSQNLRLAEQLGAETVTLSGLNVAEELVAYARTRNATRIVVGKPERPRWRRWRRWLRRSMVDDLIRRSGEIDVHAIRAGPEGAAEADAEGHAEPDDAAPPEAPLEPPPGQATGRSARTARAPAVGDRWERWRGYARAVLAVAAATAVGFVAHRALKLSDTNILMVYLLSVLWVATRGGRGAAVVASLLGVAAFDYCFVRPYYTLTVEDPQYVITLAVMFLTAVTLSTLTDRVRRSAEAARLRERRTLALYSLSRELAGTREADALYRAAAEQVARFFDCDAVVLSADRADGTDGAGGRSGTVGASGASGAAKPLSVRTAGRGADWAPDEAELSVARWALEHDRAAGRGTATLPGAAGLYLPLVGSRGTVGVLGVRPSAQSRVDDLEQLRLLEAFANQTALAIERANLADEARVAWERVEAEFLRNTLLSSVSHDLRTPLAAITGAASTLADTGESLGTEARRDLTDTVVNESERMERVINNLLDMTRLESGGLRVQKEWQPLQEVVGSALRHARKRLAGREVRTELPDDLPMVHIDAVSMEQVLVNLLDNTVEYTPAGEAVEIAARREGGGVVIEVADRGPGLPPGREDRVFQKFFRAHREGGRRGIGLGLAICRGIVEAHGGRISAENRTGGGALFRISLPADGPPPAVDARG